MVVMELSPGALLSSVTTAVDTPPSPTTDNSFSSPATILPLVISLATLVTIIIAACVIYRKRQNQRSQELARQLRVTERKIDAIGTLKAKKEQELLGLASRKTEYHPPATAPCSSVTSLESHANVGRELEVKFVPNSQIKEEEELTTSATDPDYEIKLCDVSINTTAAQHPSSSAPSTFTNKQTNNEGEEIEGSSSYYCSSCQGSSSATTVGWDGRRVRGGRGGGDSSMVAECETIPSASSLSTVTGTVLNQPHHMTRSQSEHRHVTRQSKSKQVMKRLSAISSWNQVQGYSHIVRNLRYSSKYTTPHGTNSTNTESVPHAGTWGSNLGTNAYSTINAPSVSATTSYLAMTQNYSESRTISSSRREEGSGRPNTPVSSVTDFTTDTDGEKEKWV